MRVLVTGATGLIGRHTVELLLREGHSVRTFQRTAASPQHPTNATPQNRVNAIDAVHGDVRTDLPSLCRAAAGCGAVVHLAGRGDVRESRSDPLGYATLNATGALNALEAARAAGAVFVLASSQRIYPLQPEPCKEDDQPRPDSPYGYAKWVAELWCRMASEQYGVTTRVLRFFSVYGPGQQPNGGSGVVAIFANRALAGQPLVIESAGQRDFTDARDVARAIALAISGPGDGTHRVYNIATGTGTSFRGLAGLILHLTGSRSPIEERLEEPPGRDLVADISRAQAEIGYRPCITLQQGLDRYIQSLRAGSA